MKQSKAIKLAYAAGIFDGEGCVDITHRNRKGLINMQHDLRVKVTQKDGKIIDWLYGNFGGIVIVKNKNSTLKNPDSENWIYEWRITALKALSFLKEIYPFLQYKKEQVELGIRFQNRKKFTGRKVDSLPQNEVEVREKMLLQMQQLKHQFSKSKNPNVIEYNFKSMVQPQRLSEITPKGDAIV